MTIVAAVIPTYAPQARELHALVASLLDQGVHLMLSDDASPVTSDPTLRELESKDVIVRRHSRNRGIARGLNEGLAFAAEMKAEWLLTLDQDSTIGSTLVSDLLKTATSSSRIGVVGVEILDDRSGPVGYPSRHEGSLLVTEEVFQSGSLWSVTALAAIGGFDESLGIDGVDAAACLRLREQGLRVALAAGTHIGHQYGAGRQIAVLGRRIVSTGHSPARRESMVRNRLALAPAEFRQSPRHALRTLRRVAVNTLLGATIEEGRRANTAASLRGLRHRTPPQT